MKRFKFWLTTLMVACCCAQGAWADDVSEDDCTLLKSETVTVTGDATVIYDVRNTSDPIFVFVDGNLVRTLIGKFSPYGYSRRFDEITTGKHTIKWMCEKGKSVNADLISYQSTELTPLITANLTEPGSLGTEILYNVDHVKEVKRLKIIGKMNDEDWNVINLMKGNLYTLDMGEAEFTAISSNQFNSANTWPYLHKVILPEGVLTIGDGAFSSNYMESVNIPSTVTSIGSNAFNSSSIKEAILPDGCTSLGRAAFDCCYQMEKLRLSDEITYLPYWCFGNCVSLKELHLPAKLQTLEEGVFGGCTSLDLDLRECKNLKYVTQWAFNDTAIDSLIMADNVTSSIWGRSSQFDRCYKMVYAELPVGYSDLTGSALFQDCYNLKNIVLKSPTVVKGGFSGRFDKTDVVIHVPSYLVNSYKLDEYWYNFNIEGFSTADIDYWYLSNPLTLNARDRFEGNPSLEIATSGALKVNGDAPMNLKDLTIRVQKSNAAYGQLFSNCGNIKVNGTFDVCYTTVAKRWYFLSLPFDTKVSDITNQNGSAYAVRYYDGAARAANGAGGNWKNYASDAVIKAGTGFMLQTSKDEITHFRAMENASKQNVVSTTEFVKTLAANNSTNAANKGWNAVGNPWQCYYNIHSLNFTAPITIYNENNGNYTAYSVIDDDYAIRPNEAFFVQCPDAVTSIGFPTKGRQLTSVIESQNGAKARAPQAEERLLMDVELSDGAQSDKTRLVVNPRASMDYETACDASKFFATESGMPQIYSVDDEGTEYAINERPLADGLLSLGLLIPADGTYTLSAPRNELGRAVLVDTVTGIETDLSEGGYAFEAEAGALTGRFYIDLSETLATGIEVVKSAETEGRDDVYFNLAGQRVVQPVKGIYIRGGKKVLVK